MRSVAQTSKHLAQLLALSAMGLVFALFLAEGALRLFPKALPLGMQIGLFNRASDRQNADPVIGNRPPPNSAGTIWTADFRHEYSTDSQGFRNEEPLPHHADVVVIGDSLVFGYGVERDQAWPQILASELPGSKVVNLGLIGAGPQQYLRVYEAVGKLFHPRLVVVGLFPRNDFWDAELFDEWLALGAPGSYMRWRDTGRTGSIGWNHPVDRALELVRSHSYVYLLARFARSAWRQRRVRGPVVMEWRRGGSLQLDLEGFAAETRHADAHDPVFASAMSAIRQLRDEAAAKGARTVAVIQPSKIETYSQLAGEPVADAGVSVRAALDAMGVPYLDLGPVFRAHAAAGEDLFFPTDGHPNANGYRLTANAVARWLKETDASN